MTGPEFILEVAIVLGEAAVRAPILRAVMETELRVPSETVSPSRARDLWGREGLQKLIDAGLGGRTYDIPGGAEIKDFNLELAVTNGVSLGRSNMKIALATGFKEREVTAMRARLNRAGRLSWSNQSLAGPQRYSTQPEEQT